MKVLSQTQLCLLTTASRLLEVWVIPFDTLRSVVLVSSDGKLPHLLSKNEMSCYLKQIIFLNQNDLSY